MSATTPLRLAVIIAGTREGRFGPTIASWFADQARQRGDLDVDVPWTWPRPGCRTG
jgi:NAD(P)H-dependent FMN reductase